MPAPDRSRKRRVACCPLRHLFHDEGLPEAAPPSTRTTNTRCARGASSLPGRSALTRAGLIARAHSRLRPSALAQHGPRPLARAGTADPFDAGRLNAAADGTSVLALDRREC